MKQTCTLLLTAGFCATLTLAHAQSQIVTPDNQVVSIQSVNGTNNLFIGQSTTATIGGTGTFNTFMGSQSGQSNTSGSYNTYYGYKAGFPNTTGSNNTLVGYEAGKLNVSGSDNVFIGYNAGQRNQGGHRNVIMGTGAGFNDRDGSDNTLLGANATAIGVGLSNATAIGANARVLSSNALVLGNGANVGIGTSSPVAKLDVVADQPDQSGLRFGQLNDRSPVSARTDRFLSVNERGEVVMATYRLRINEPADWADRVFAPTYRLRSLSEVAQFIKANQHLPGVPSAEEVTREGVDLVQMNAKLLEKVEELTLYVIELQRQVNELKSAGAAQKPVK
ncbi:hypothetical protein [Spirosoma sordidisoli]|uniref:BZIP transcription factor n=1 Tax=Spirosoma sordidisoli TaxID=2502893 RepID=A0A4Q2UEV6_9BACT|nr:hypothetical protein [Spirosoma sordidisoli]RYC67456.1 hypothetical protein EQG79_25480 [Spirosoma sordidisoli]